MKKLLIAILLFSGSGAMADELVPTKEEKVRTVSQNWKKYCSKCHDSEGNSTKIGARFGSPENIYEHLAGVPADDIFKVLVEGKNKMPSFKKKLSEQELKEIALHIEYSSMIDGMMDKREVIEKKLKEIKKDFPNLPPCDTINVQ